MKALAILTPLAAIALSLAPAPGEALAGAPPAAQVNGSLARWHLSAEPTVVIGGTDERESHLLHQVFGATRLTDGRIVVASGGTLHLRYYDAEGRHLLDAGGRGDGPGELQSLEHFTRLSGDSILVLSWRGVTRFGPDGRYASTRPHQPLAYPDCRSLEGGRFLLPDGSMLLAFSVFTGLDSNHEPCPTPGEARAPVLIGRNVPTNGGLDTIAELPGLERTYGRESNDRESRYAYARNTVFGIAHDRVYVGDTGAATVFAMSFSGDTIAAMPVPFERTPVAADARAMASKEEEWSGGGERYTLHITYLYPDHYPRFARLVADPEERVWVMAYPALKEPVWPWELELPRAFRRLEDGAAWRVVEPSGLIAAELTTPPGFFLLEVGDDYVLGLSKDELERESVQLYRLIKSR